MLHIHTSPGVELCNYGLNSSTKTNITFIFKA